MTEKELRENVRRQILQNFHENKRTATVVTANNKLSLTELRTIVRQELVKRLNEQKSDADLKSAAEMMNDLDPAVKNTIVASLQDIKKSGKKKDEALGTTAVTLALAAPGLLSLMSKLAKLVAKGLQKITKSKKFDPDNEGKTFEHAAHSLHKKYIKWLTPVVKVVFKKQIAGDDKKAEVYAQVVYAVLLAGVAAHAFAGAGAGIMHGLEDMGHIFHTAYEAAHGAHVGLEVGQMGSGIRAALAAIGEKQAASEIASAMAM